MSQVSYGIHWLRYSIGRPVGEVRDTIGGGWSDGEPRGAFNQPRHMVHESGAKLYYGSPREAQPLVLEVPGEVCEYHARDFVDHADRLDANCTRFDIAADVGPEEKTNARWLELRRHFVAGRCVTRIPSKSCHFIQSKREGDGSTAYYGARTSEMMLRVYTKRGPLRMEFEVKPDHRSARSSWTTMLKAAKPDEVWRHFGRKIRWPCEWYQHLLDGKVAVIDREPEERQAFAELLENLRLQMGPMLWMLNQLKVPMEDVSRKPANPNGLWLSEMKRLAVEAGKLGYDGAALCEAADELSKSRRK